MASLFIRSFGRESPMSYDRLSVVDGDGHIVESVAEMAGFTSPRIRQLAIKPSRNRQGVFPSLDGMHFAPSMRSAASASAKISRSGTTGHFSGQREEVFNL